LTNISFTIGLLLVGLITHLIALVLLIGLSLLLVFIIIPTLEGTIINEVTMLTTIVACSLGCGLELLISFSEFLLLYVLLEFLHEESHIFGITFRAIFFFLFSLLFT
jgi:hypothetical protein